MRVASWLLILIACGCSTPNARQQEQARAQLPPADLIDAAAKDDPPFVDGSDLVKAADKLRSARQASAKPARIFNVLALSGGGSYGAYCAGVLCGWTETGTRPTFDVVTGVSTGAIIATIVFLGPEYDCQLKRFYTTLGSDEIFTKKNQIRAALFGESLADNAPLAQQIDTFLTPEAFTKIAAAHNAGRRLYVGTTNIQTRRLVTWDMGAIAAKGDAQSQALFKQIILASAAIPGFFPPQKIGIDVAGRHYEELHVDGGATSAFLVRSPPEVEAVAGAQHTLAGSNVYILVAGKLFADQDVVKPKTLAIASNAISSILYAMTRYQLNEIYLATMLLGVNYRVAAIPQEYPAPLSSTDFVPAEMAGMFSEGCKRAREGTAWRSTPVLLEEQPLLQKRTGTQLVTSPKPLTRPAAGPEPNGIVPRTPEGIPVPIPPNAK